MTQKTFTQYDFKPFLIDAVRELRFTEPTGIQQKIFPVVKKGVSVIGQSQTGSGKTHAYLLPTLNKLMQAVKKYNLLLQHLLVS